MRILRLKPQTEFAPSAIVVAASFGLVVWVLVPVFQGRLGLELLLYMIAMIMPFVDALDMAVRLSIISRESGANDGNTDPTSVPLHIGEFTPYQIRLHTKPYALVVAVHNPGDEFDDFLEALGPFRDRLFVVDDASTDETWFRLVQSGVKCVRVSRNRKKPGAIKELLAQLPPEIVSVMVLDPDVYVLDGTPEAQLRLERVIFEFQRSGRAAAAPRVTVRPEGLLSALQNFEYSLACALGRRSLADRCVTPGVALYRRDALAEALESHDLSVYAEDLRNALILFGKGESAYYDGRMVVETQGKRTWKAWFSQRVGWSFGLIKVYAESFRDVCCSARGRPFFAYQFFVYMGMFSVPLQPLRLLSLMLLLASTLGALDTLLGLELISDVVNSSPEYFVAAYLKYTAFALIASVVVSGRGVKWIRLAPVVPVYFFYALAQIVPATIGYVNWFTLRWAGARLYQDHYMDEQSLRQQMARGHQ
jgi:cellulose synthase/poly-beta-1,6-N-acetylglucosamine synthase-like glycosyltransferase